MHVITGFPVVTVIPSSYSAEVTQTVTFAANVSGVGVENFTYQWKIGPNSIFGKNTNTLTITNVMESDGGTYRCLVTNLYGNTVSSNVATLIVSSM